MFIVNGETLHEKSHPKEYKWMMNQIAKIKSGDKKEYTFSAFNKRSKVLREDGRWIPQRGKKRIVTMVGSTEEATGVHQSWAYATSMSALKDDGSNRYKLKRLTRSMDHDTRFSVEKDSELIFFFMCLSNNRNVNEIDHAAINKKAAQDNALRSKAESLIYSYDSPIHPENIKSETPLKNIALSWGIGNALDMDVYLLMQELWSKVQTNQARIGQTGKGYEKFIEDVTKYGNVDKRATVTLAIQEGILYYDSHMWKMVTEGDDAFLCGVSPQDEAQKENYVMDYVLNHAPVFLAVESLLKNPIEKFNMEKEEEDANEKAKEKTKEKIARVPRGELLRKAKEDLGWGGENYRAISRMNQTELEELISSKRRPELVIKE